MPHAAVRELRPAGGISQAVIRVVEAGQRLVIDRIDLATLDAKRLAVHAVGAAIFVTAGTVCLAGAWFALLAGGVVFALTYMPLANALALAAAVSLAIGGALIAFGLRRAPQVRTYIRDPGVNPS